MERWATAAAGPAPVFAHDFWLEAHPYRVQSGDMVEVSVHVGTGMRGNILPNIPAWYEDFSFMDGGGRHPVDGEIGRDPAGVFRAEAAGLTVVGYQSAPKFVELDAEHFRDYLEAEGLDYITPIFDQRNPSPATAPEFYTRFVKTYVSAGNGAGVAVDAAFGYRLELVPLQDPYQLAVGSSWPLRLDYEGRPIEGVAVFAFTKEQPDAIQRVATGADGVATVDLDRPGEWLVKATHMIESPLADADWESFWASVTFELR